MKKYFLKLVLLLITYPNLSFSQTLNDTLKLSVRGSKTSYVTFFVDTIGKVNKVTLLKSCGDTILDNEALKAITEMPDWKPGKRDGKNVEVKYNIPVNHGCKYNMDGVELYLDGRYKEALLVFRNAITEDSKCKDSYYNRGCCYVKLGKNDKACNDFKKAKELGDNSLDSVISQLCGK